MVDMASKKDEFENNADFWNWLKNRDAEPDVLVPLELTIDHHPLPPRENGVHGNRTHDVSREFEINHDVSFEISGNVVYELG